MKVGIGCPVQVSRCQMQAPSTPTLSRCTGLLPRPRQQGKYILHTTEGQMNTLQRLL